MKRGPSNPNPVIRQTVMRQPPKISREIAVLQTQFTEDGGMIRTMAVQENEALSGDARG
jgi:hypothetical protein